MGFLGKLLGGTSTGDGSKGGESKAARVVPEHIETAADFERVVAAGEGPTVLYVWGSGCGPCRQMSQEIVAAATKHAGRVRFAELSTEGDRTLLSALEVRSTPTVIVYEDGDEIGRQVGFRPAAWFDEMVEAEFAG
jgi:thioredoxin-like negative regulator of GroEL